MFASNVQPKRRVVSSRPWQHHCAKRRTVVGTHMYSCPYGCGARRPN